MTSLQIEPRNRSLETTVADARVKLRFSRKSSESPLTLPTVTFYFGIWFPLMLRPLDVTALDM